MILEEATKEAYGYYARDLTHGSGKLILAACELCGEYKVTTKDAYRTFCHSCSHILGEKNKGKNSIMFGKHLSKERKAKLRVVMKGNTYGLGYKRTEEEKALISVVSKGNTYALGYKHTEEAKAKIGAANKGNKHWNWQNGKSYEPYCVKFNNVFKDYIRSKFGHKCFLCPTTQAENGKKLDVHHVNYNKDCGCDGDKTCNFVPLCRCCHTKTNTNRDYWQKIITDKLHSTIIGWSI